MQVQKEQNGRRWKKSMLLTTEVRNAAQKKHNNSVGIHSCYCYHILSGTKIWQ